MSEWKEVKLGDVCEINPKEHIKKEGIYKKIAMEDLIPFKKYIKNFTYEKFTGGSKFKNGDILLARITPSLENGKTSMVNLLDTNEVGFGSTEFIVFREKKGITDKHFLYYLLIFNHFREIAIKSMTGSSGRQRVQKETIENYTFYLPPLPIQKKIADILSVIDEKIETLQNINETLENMAKAIFKSWFVDFDIVKAKAEGKSDSEIAKEFGISKEIVKLFPSEFETSEIGKIPKGWKVRKLGEFLPVKTGKKNANIATNNGIYPFFTCSQEVLKTNSYSFNDSAILLAGNGDFNIKWYRGKFEAYQRTYVLIPYDQNNLGYLFFAMKHFLDLITGASQGSVIKFITKGMIENFKIVYPNNIKFINFFNQILDNIENNTNQIQTLQNLRDTLLPKLINGEIEVDKLDIKGITDGFN